MQIKPFSKKQKQVLSWWMPNSPVAHYEGIIADGSIRSGKTVSMTLSYIAWAMNSFEDDLLNFGLCGKTINSFRRNVWSWSKPILFARGYLMEESRDENMVRITYGDTINHFYMFGGKDERSQDLIQGITLAGCLFDEVALMPQSFVNQATGRCSVTGSKFWFNCNPDHPKHWFKENWIDRAEEKKLLYLHFTMDDNLSLDEAIKERYKSLYTGVFFKRFILGQWVVAEGSIYDMWTEENEYEELSLHIQTVATRWVACDYGTTNPMAALLVYDDGDDIWVDDEYYFDSRAEGYQKTDSQYVDEIEKQYDLWQTRGFIVDPAAASFIVELRKRGYRVRKADNEVLDGIRLVSSLIAKRRLHINKRCTNTLKELGGYVWDPSSNITGKEKPLKMADHAMDALRYYVKTNVNPRRLND